jgi:hypothetical protein
MTKEEQEKQTDKVSLWCDYLWKRDQLQLRESLRDAGLMEDWEREFDRRRDDK